MMKKSFSMKKEKNKNKKKNRLHLLTQKDMNVMLLKKFCAKFHGKKTLYLVKWVGYKDPTWEPEEFLRDEEGREIIPLKHYLGNSYR